MSGTSSIKAGLLFLFCNILLFSCACFITRTASSRNIRARWQLISLGDTLEVAGKYKSYLHFGSDNKIDASAICNTISGGYFTEAGKMEVRLSGLVMSYLGCHDLRTEAILLNALKNTNRYSIKEDTLLLFHNDQKLATYKKAEHL